MSPWLNDLINTWSGPWIKAWVMAHPILSVVVGILSVISWLWLLGTVGITGTYYLEGTNDTVYTDLEWAGTYYQMQEGKCSVDGTYIIKGDEVQFHHLFGVFIMTKDGNDLIDEDGDRWIKKRKG